MLTTNPFLCVASRCCFVGGTRQSVHLPEFWSPRQSSSAFDDVTGRPLKLYVASTRYRCRRVVTPPYSEKLAVGRTWFAHRPLISALRLSYSEVLSVWRTPRRSSPSRHFREAAASLNWPIDFLSAVETGLFSYFHRREYCIVRSATSCLFILGILSITYFLCKICCALYIL